MERVLSVTLAAGVALLAAAGDLATVYAGLASTPHLHPIALAAAVSVAAVLTVFKVWLPFCIARLWLPVRPEASALGLLWVSSVVVCTTSGILALLASTMLSDWPRSVRWLVVGGWVTVEAAAAILPFAVARCAQLTADDVKGDPDTAAAPVPPRPNRVDLLFLLSEMARREDSAPGVNYIAGPAGQIVTTQASLGLALGRSKSWINGQLKLLQEQGRIVCNTSRNDTIIRVLPAQVLENAPSLVENTKQNAA